MSFGPTTQCTFLNTDDAVRYRRVRDAGKQKNRPRFFGSGGTRKCSRVVGPSYDCKEGGCAKDMCLGGCASMIPSLGDLNVPHRGFIAKPSIDKQHVSLVNHVLQLWA